MGNYPKFDEFFNNYTAAVNSIKYHLECDDENVRKLVNWLMTTDINPYEFLPESYAGCFNSAEGFASLCGTIHHALVDDGAIEFIKVNDEPRIAFIERWTSDFEDLVLTKQELEWKRDGFGCRTITYKITFLSGVDEFITEMETYTVNHLKKSFMWDYRKDPEYAVEHYSSKYPRFQQSWIDEAKSKK